MSGWDDNPAAAHITPLERRLAAKFLKVMPDQVQGPISGTLVGECPGENTSEKLPMFPYPPNSAGGRLLKMSCLPAAHYLGKLKRTNLFRLHQAKWDKRRADEAAAELAVTFGEKHHVVLLGQKVAEAFGFDKWYEVVDIDGTFFTSIPHPSGLNLMYNDPNHRVGARAAVQWAAKMMIGGPIV